MSNICPFINKQITSSIPTGSWGQIDVFANIDFYVIQTTTSVVNITADWLLTPLGTPQEGTIVRFFFNTNIFLNGHVISIFGFPLTQEEVQQSMIIEMVYVNGQWEIYKSNNSSVPSSGTEVIDIGSGTGDIFTLEVGVNNKYVIITGEPVLTGQYLIGGNGINDGDEFWIKYEALAAGSATGDITIFDRQLTVSQQLLGNTTVYAKYSDKDSAWHTTLITDDSTVTTPLKFYSPIDTDWYDAELNLIVVHNLGTEALQVNLFDSDKIRKTDIPYQIVDNNTIKMFTGEILTGFILIM